MARRTIAIAIVGATLVGLGCSTVYEYPKTTPEDTAATCKDGLDNDLDGRADCYDPGCASFCSESTLARCTDGADNDFDGVADCRDPDCRSFCGETSNATCHDGVDGNLDGLADCADPTCASFCQESEDPACHDGTDDDQDGLTDCKDPGCAAACTETTAERCSDGVDDDQDSKVDCQDDDCKAFCPETGAAACADHVDNDFDGKVDCTDPDCDGQCPEVSAADCSDARDNDGDGLMDATDPRCWVYFPPVAQRCGVADEVNFSERFDDANSLGPPFYPARWFEFGSYKDSTGSTEPIVNAGRRSLLLTQRDDRVAYFAFNTTGDSALGNGNLGGMSTLRTFIGEWYGLALHFSAYVPRNAILRVALLPSALAPSGQLPSTDAGAALLSVVLDGAANPPTLSLEQGGSRVSARLPLQSACGLKFCAGGWNDVDVGYQSGQIVAKISGPAGDATVTAPAPESTEMPESRLVIWGGSTSVPSGFENGDLSAPEIDDVRLQVSATDPCGVSAPQVPFSSCDYAAQFGAAGETVSVAQGGDGEYCALVTARRSGSPSADSVTSWSSTDGKAWGPAASGSALSVFELPANTTLVGAGLAHDGGSYVGAVAYRMKDKVEVALATSATCADLASFKDGLELPFDAEAPSYVLANGRHEIYFTRPPTDQTGRTLWRASGPDQRSIVLEASPLAELSSSMLASAPASIARVGTNDLVMTYRTQPASAGFSGAGVLVGDATGSSWSAVSPLPFLSGGGLGSFDNEGVASAAIAWGRSGGFMLYGGLRHDGITAGTALLWPAGTVPSAAAPTCGNKKCDNRESCETCPADCPCPGVSLLSAPLAKTGGWTIISAESYQPESKSYVDTSTQTLAFSGSFSQTWSVLPLPRSIIGDFDLSFDLDVIVTGDSPDCDPALVGLGQIPDASNYDPIGVFARISYETGCDTAQYGLSPYLKTVDRTYGTMAFESYLNCATGALGVDLDARRHVLLSKQNDAVTVSVYDQHGCANTQTRRYTGALPELPALLVGYGFTNQAHSFSDCTGVSAEVSNVVLRLPSDPARCGATETLCGTGSEQSACVDTSKSPEHCGACDKPCPYHFDCVDATCQCAAGTQLCGGKCVDVNSSLTDCGGCGNKCTTFCLVGGCGAGETCATARALPPGSGLYPLDLTGRATDIPEFGGTNDVAFTWQATTPGPVKIQARANGKFIPHLLVTKDATCSSFDFRPEVGGLSTGFVEDVYFAADVGTTYYVVVGFSTVSSPVTDATLQLAIEAQ